MDTSAIAATLRTVKKNYEDNEARAAECYWGSWEEM